jgi:hypothetical protein
LSVLAHMRRLLLPIAIVVAIVAIAVPTCRMVGCDMDMGAMRFIPHNGPHFSSMCPGQWEFSSAPTGILPTGSDPLVLGFAALAVAAFVLVAPRRMARPLFAYAGSPPPPPEDPLGARFRV